MASLSDRIVAAVVGILSRGEPRIQLPHGSSPPDEDAADSDPSTEAFGIGTPMHEHGATGAPSEAGSGGSRLSNTELLLRELLDADNATIAGLRGQLREERAKWKHALKDAEQETMRAVLAKDKAEAEFGSFREARESAVKALARPKPEKHVRASRSTAPRQPRRRRRAKVERADAPPDQVDSDSERESESEKAGTDDHNSSCAEWEVMGAVVESGASVIVIPPRVAGGYAIRESAASRAGVQYEIANGDEIPNLCEKLFAVVTEEGTVRGTRPQVADVSKALQSVRALVSTGHVVVFGDGGSGTEH